MCSTDSESMMSMDTMIDGQNSSPYPNMGMMRNIPLRDHYIGERGSMYSQSSPYREPSRFINSANNYQPTQSSFNGSDASPMQDMFSPEEFSDATRGDDRMFIYTNPLHAQLYPDTEEDEYCRQSNYRMYKPTDDSMSLRSDRNNDPDGYYYMGYEHRHPSNSYSSSVSTNSRHLKPQSSSGYNFQRPPNVGNFDVEQMSPYLPRLRDSTFFKQRYLKDLKNIFGTERLQMIV